MLKIDIEIIVKAGEDFYCDEDKVNTALINVDGENLKKYISPPIKGVGNIYNLNANTVLICVSGEEEIKGKYVNFHDCNIGIILNHSKGNTSLPSPNSSGKHYGLNLTFKRCFIHSIFPAFSIGSINLFNSVVVDARLMRVEKITYIISEEELEEGKFGKVLDFTSKSFEDFWSQEQVINIWNINGPVRFQGKNLEAQKTNVTKVFALLNLSIRSSYVEEKTDSFEERYNSEKGHYYFNNLPIQLLRFSGEIPFGISISYCALNRLELDNYRSQKKCDLYAVSSFAESSYFDCEQSDLSKVKFVNVDFNSFESISFHRSSLDRNNFSACIFPWKIKDFEKFKVFHLSTTYKFKLHSDNQRYYESERYTMLIQLREAIKAAGHSFDAQNMNAFAQESLLKSGKAKWFNYFTLRLNSISNFHGIAVGRSFGLLLIFSVSLYIFYLFSIDRIFCSTKPSDFDWLLFARYFDFINPVHKSNFILEQDSLVDYRLAANIEAFSRVIIAFLIYQFIATFRKFGKK